MAKYTRDIDFEILILETLMDRDFRGDNLSAEIIRSEFRASVTLPMIKKALREIHKTGYITSTDIDGVTHYRLTGTGYTPEEEAEQIEAQAKMIPYEIDGVTYYKINGTGNTSEGEIAKTLAEIKEDPDSWGLTRV